MFVGFIVRMADINSSTIELDFKGVRAMISLSAENTIQKMGLEIISSIVLYQLSSLV